MTLYVAGQFVEGEGAERTLVNPAKGTDLETLRDATEKQVADAIASARTAFDTTDWAVDVNRRVDILRRTADALSDNAEEMARIETTNTGKPIRESRLDVEDSITCLRYYADLVENRTPWAKQMPDGTTSRVVEEPIGVCGLIVPWNFPLLLAVWKLAPALAAGNTIVVKPSELTPLSLIRLTELFHEAGLPAGVLNLVLGGGNVGQAIVNDPQVEKISFTGSVPTGQAVYEQCAKTLKRVSLELGGKSPLIVYDDVDVAQAVEWALFGSFFNQGEVCVASSRILVHEKVYEPFVEQLVEKAATIPMGDPLHESTELGPLISENHLNSVLGYVESGFAEGARCLFGGKQHSQLPGFYFLPTVFVDVEQQMRIVQEEIFGPVATVQSFRSDDEAIALANGTKYGLAAGILCNDLERAERVASALKAGTIWINSYHTPYVEAPWGGFKYSGMGRELGPYGLANYVELKHINATAKLTSLGWHTLS